MKIINLIALGLISAAPITATAAVTISSNNSGGSGRTITSSTGTAVVTGSIRIGYFANIVGSDSVMRGGDYAALNAIFIPLGEVGSDATGGDVTSPVVAGNNPIPIGATAGKYTGQITGIKNSYLPTGTRLFILASNSLDPKSSAPTEWALVSDAAWVAPLDDVNLGGSITLSLNNTNINDANADVWRGTIGTSGVLNLAAATPIPEPTIASLMLVLGGLTVSTRRRR